MGCVSSSVKPDSANSSREHVLDSGLVYCEAQDNSNNLFSAIKRGDLDTVKQIAETNKNINNLIGMWNSTPLIVAIQYNNLEITEYLLSLNITIETLQHNNDKGANALVYACMDNNFYSIIKLLLDKYNLTISDNPTKEPIYNSITDRTMRCTPLSVAITNGHHEIVKILLDNGCNINHRFNFPTVKSIRRNNNDDKKKSNNDNGVHTNNIESASSINFPSMKADSISYRSDNEEDSKDALSLTPILLACANARLSVVRELLYYSTKQCECFCFDSEGSSILHHLGRVKSDDSVDILRELIKHNKINNLLLSGVDCNGETPLHVACDNKNSGIAKLLLEEGANPSTRSSETGQTPLHLALKRRSLEVCKILLEYGADPLITDDKGLSPYDTSLKIHKDSALRQAVEQAGLSWLRLRGVTVEQFDPTDLCAIAEASSQGSSSLSRGSSVNAGAIQVITTLHNCALSTDDENRSDNEISVLNISHHVSPKTRLHNVDNGAIVTEVVNKDTSCVEKSNIQKTSHNSDNIDSEIVDDGSDVKPFHPLNDSIMTAVDADIILSGAIAREVAGALGAAMKMAPSRRYDSDSEEEQVDNNGNSGEVAKKEDGTASKPENTKANSNNNIQENSKDNGSNKMANSKPRNSNSNSNNSGTPLKPKYSHKEPEVLGSQSASKTCNNKSQSSSVKNNNSKAISHSVGSTPIRNSTNSSSNMDDEAKFAADSDVKQVQKKLFSEDKVATVSNNSVKSGNSSNKSIGSSRGRKPSTGSSFKPVPPTRKNSITNYNNSNNKGSVKATGSGNFRSGRYGTRKPSM